MGKHLNLPSNWGGANTLPSQSLFSLYADTIGSVGNPQATANLEASMNGYKARVFQPDLNAMAIGKFNAFANTPTIRNTADAVTLLRLVCTRCCYC